MFFFWGNFYINQKKHDVFKIISKIFCIWARKNMIYQNYLQNSQKKIYIEEILAEKSMFFFGKFFFILVRNHFFKIISKIFFILARKNMIHQIISKITRKIFISEEGNPGWKNRVFFWEIFYINQKKHDFSNLSRKSFLY